MKDKGLAVALLVGGGALLLYAKHRADQGLPLFGGSLGSVAGHGDPRFQANLTGIQGTGNTNPIAAALTGLSSAVAKLFGSAVASAPRQSAPATGAPTGALNAGGTPTTGLPPTGDRTHDPFAGFDQFELWSPQTALDWEQSTWIGVPDAGYVLPGELPAGYDDFAGLER